MSEAERPLACDLHAFSPEQRSRYGVLLGELRGVVTKVTALPEGYAFHLADRGDSILHAAEFVALERLCCPFLQLELKVAPFRAGVRLELTGPAGVKDFIAAELPIVRDAV